LLLANLETIHQNWRKYYDILLESFNKRFANLKYVFDIDGTICTTSGSDYENSQPIKERIQEINDLYDNGHTIVFHTARGMGRTDDNILQAFELFFEITADQLEQWGVRYHRLFLGKPSGDLYVDDKGIKDSDYFKKRD